MLRSVTFVLVCAFAFVQAQASPKKPIVYLTFDDGPSGDNVTDRLLEVLSLYDAKATFFVTGARAQANPEKIRSIYNAGHTLGNHTQSHGRLTDLFDHEVVQELSSTNLHVMDAGGPVMNCFRAPFGNSNLKVENIAKSMGLRKAGWTIDTRDWNPHTNASYIGLQLDDVTNESVVLMHDGPSSRWRTLSVFTRWMEEVGNLYSFEAMPECVEPMLDVAPSWPQTFAAVSFEPVVDFRVVSARAEKPLAGARSADAAPAVVVAAKDQTIRGLIEKLNNYEIVLR